jgi:hypothetical protein
MKLPDRERFRTNLSHLAREVIGVICLYLWSCADFLRGEVLSREVGLLTRLLSLPLLAVNQIVKKFVATEKQQSG